MSKLVDVGLARSVKFDGKPRIRVETQPGGLQLVIAVRDRLGLFGDTAGLLASHAIQVRSAVLHTVERISVNTWRVDKQTLVDLPDVAYLVKQLERLDAGESGILDSVRRREARVRSRPNDLEAARRARARRQRERGRRRGPHRRPGRAALRPRSRAQRGEAVDPVGARLHPRGPGHRHVLRHRGRRITAERWSEATRRSAR